MEDAKNTRTTLVVLAGGKASRMQNLTQCQSRKKNATNAQTIDQNIDKALLRIEGKTLVERTLERLQDKANPFVARAINSNADPDTLRDIVRQFQLEIFPDSPHHKHLGPLGGILAAMRWSETKKAAWLLTVPCDCPFLPKDLWQQLQQRQRKTGADIVCAFSHERRHPVVALWSVAQNNKLRGSLEEALGKGMRKIDRWTEQHHTESQAWQATPDPFFNINRPEDLEQAEALARATKRA